MKSKIPSLIILSLALNACAGLSGQSSSFLLKSPIQNQCQSSGLNACDAITSGIISYIDGNSKIGQQKLQNGISQNCDKIQEIQTLTNSLETLSYIPYAKQYVAYIMPIVKFINQCSQQCEISSTPNLLTSTHQQNQQVVVTNQSEYLSEINTLKIEVQSIRNQLNVLKTQKQMTMLCDKPFYFDTNGIKHIRIECLYENDNVSPQIPKNSYNTDPHDVGF